MKSKRLLLPVLVFGVGLFIGYALGVRRSEVRPATNLKQIGLAFRYGVNDVAALYPSR